MSDIDMAGRRPAAEKAGVRDGVGLALLVLGTFAAASAAWDVWQGGTDGGGANRTTAVLVGALDALGTAAVIGGGVLLTIAGAWLFARRERVVAVPFALALAGFVLALPFLVGFVRPGSGGALGALAAPEGAGNGLRVLSLALGLTFALAGTYALAAAFGRERALIALLRGGVSGPSPAVKEIGPKSDGRAQGQSHDPHPAQRGTAARDAHAGGRQPARADLAAEPAARPAAAARGTAVPRPLAGAAESERAPGALPLAAVGLSATSDDDGLRLVVAGKLVEPESVYDREAEESAHAAPVRQLATAPSARPIGSRPSAAPAAPEPVALGAGALARPLGTAPAPDPAAGLAPLAVGVVGGERARAIGTAKDAAVAAAAAVEDVEVDEEEEELFAEEEPAVQAIAVAEEIEEEIEEDEELDDGEELDEDVEDDELEAELEDDGEDADEEEDSEDEVAEDDEELWAEDDESYDDEDEDEDGETDDAEESEDDEVYAEEEDGLDADEVDDADEIEDADEADDAADEDEPAPLFADAARASAAPPARPQPVELDLFADAGIEEGVGRTQEPELVVTPAARRRTGGGSRRKKPEAAPVPVLAADDREQLIHAAGLLFLEEGRVAVSLLQKRFTLDFQRSTEILDALQQRGLIGPYLGGQRRDILMTKDEWLAAQTR